MNATNNEGSTALDLARVQGHDEVVILLLDSGGQDGFFVFQCLWELCCCWSVPILDSVNEYSEVAET